MFPKASDKTFLDKLQENHLGKTTAYSKVNKSRKGAKDAHFELGHYAGNVSKRFKPYKPGSVIQSIVSLTALLRRQLVKYMPTKLSNTLLFFVEKM